LQSILDEANEDTLTEVTLFINGARQTAYSNPPPFGAGTWLTDLSITGKVPTGFIVTGPNISSQELLFKQLSSRLKMNTSGPVTILRSGDASNMKSILKQLIRDATNQKPTADDEEGPSFEQDVS
jgi:origin recognition complex subunit 3